MGRAGASLEIVCGPSRPDKHVSRLQQEQLLPTPLPSPTPADDSTAPEAAQPSPTPSQTLSKRVTNFHFPRRQFDLSPDPSIQVAAFQRGLLPKGSKHESPVPDDAPLREVSVPLPEGQDGGETSGRGKRKKRAGGAAAGGSPRKKQKVEKKLSGGEEDESELSELSDADEVAESEEGDAEGDEDAGEDGEEDDGTSVTGTAVTADDDSASTATEADAKRKPADKGVSRLFDPAASSALTPLSTVLSRGHPVPAIIQSPIPRVERQGAPGFDASVERRRYLDPGKEGNTEHSKDGEEGGSADGECAEVVAAEAVVDPSNAQLIIRLPRTSRRTLRPAGLLRSNVCFASIRSQALSPP